MKLRDVMTRNVMTVQLSDTLELARETMLWGGFRHLPVVDGGAIVGILSERDILQAKGSAAARERDPMVCDVMRVPVETASPEASVEATALRMSSRKIGAMPIVDDGKLVGMVTVTDLLAQIGRPAPSSADFSLPPVAVVMTENPATAHAGEPLADAAARMVANHVRHLPVVGVSGKVTAILSDRDVLRAMTITHSRHLGPTSALQEKTVSDAMTEDPIVLELDASVEEALTIFVERRVGAIPIVDGRGRLRGILSYVDVLAWLGRNSPARKSPELMTP